MMETYEAIFDETEVDGVFGISLVHDPAMKGQFIALAKQKVQFKTVNEEKRIVVGLVLEPNKLIPRNGGDGEAFNMIFSEDTVKNLCYAFTKNSHNKNSSLEHENKVDKVTFVENWIVRDDKQDTGIALGLEVKKGQWLSVAKIDNDEVWNDYVKTGRVTGFSIDAMLSLKKVNLKLEIEMAEEKMSFLEQLKVMFAEVGLVKKEKEEVKLGSVVSGDITIQYEGDTPEVGLAVWVEQNDERVPLPDGNYPSDLGVLVVADGVITEIQAEVEAESETSAAPAPSPEDAVQAIKSLLIKYKEENVEIIKLLSDRVDKFEDANKTLKEEVVTLSKQPAVKAIKTEVKQKAYIEMTNFEKMQYNKIN